MKPDSWIIPEEVLSRLQKIGYTVSQQGDRIVYKKTGVSGRITIHSWGVDEWAVERLESRG